MPEIYPVGMADLRIAKSPDVLAAYGVGSCVIIVMFDPKTAIGGMSHIMLPDSKNVSQGKLNPKKFADTAIPLLFQSLTHAGVYKTSLWVKLFGGAEMFPPTEDFTSNIGKLNVESAMAALKKLSVPVRSNETGGNSGRSLEFDLASGKITLNILGEMTKII